MARRPPNLDQHREDTHKAITSQTLAFYGKELGKEEAMHIATCIIDDVKYDPDRNEVNHVR